MLLLIIVKLGLVQLSMAQADNVYRKWTDGYSQLQATCFRIFHRLLLQHQGSLNMINLKKIGNRLYLAFAVLIILEFVTVFVGYRQFQTIQVLSVKVGQDQWPKTVIANKIIDNIHIINWNDFLEKMWLNQLS